VNGQSGSSRASNDLVQRSFDQSLLRTASFWRDLELEVEAISGRPLRAARG